VPPNPRIDSRDQQLLGGLRRKYQIIRELRLAAAADAGIAPRARLAALARAFPGALRELDQLPMSDIEARLLALERVLDQGAQPEQWMQLQASYHGFMRAVLRIRLRSRGRPLEIDDAERELLAVRYEPAADEPPIERFDLVALRVIRRPPGGRLNPWVFSEVARDHGVNPELVRQALFLR
jgi:hypothetical protein